MEIFNAANLAYVLGGFAKTIEISALFIICFPLAMLGQWLERRSKERPRAKVIPGVTDVPAPAAGKEA